MICNLLHSCLTNSVDEENESCDELTNVHSQLRLLNISYDNPMISQIYQDAVAMLNSLKTGNNKQCNDKIERLTEKDKILYQQIEAVKEALESFSTGSGVCLCDENGIKGVMNYTIEIYPNRPKKMIIWCLTKAPQCILNGEFGIGTQLLNEAIYVAKNQCVKIIEVTSFNALSTSFYLKKNFIFQSKNPYRNTKKPQIMELNIRLLSKPVLIEKIDDF